MESEDDTATVKATCLRMHSGQRGENHHFLDLIRETVQKNAEQVYASWYDINGKCKNTKRDIRTFGQIWNNAGTIAYHLRCKWHVKKGQRVILCYDFGLHFFEVFLGCLRAGVVAVLVYPPAPPFKKSLLKLAKVVDDCEPALILMDTKVQLGRLSDKANLLSESRRLWPDHVEFKVTDTLLNKSGLSFDEKTDVSDLAFLQYTSGSTGEPKGCMVTFKALASNVLLIHYGYYQCYEADGGIPEEIVGFSWLPQYHDLGLIFTGIAPFVAGWRMHMISPFTFLKKPLLWLELMSRHKVQWSVAPDFSYGLAARNCQELQQTLAPLQASAKENQQPLPALDLSSIRFLTTAAEPCRPEVKDKFGKIFSTYGLRENWYSSGYGLAENVVGVSYVHGMHVSAPRQEDHSKVYVAAAKLSDVHQSLILKIVDPETSTEVTGDATGELWIAGPSVVAGYFGKPKLSEETFKARLSDIPGMDFLRTGDLAFFQNGRMYICGRIKDLIIFNGANHYPQDVEFAVQDASNAVRPGCVAAFASNEIEEESSVEVVFEIRKDRVPEAENVCSMVRKSIVQAIGIPISRVVAIAERSIPKTTSGKIQRRATRDALHSGKLKVIHSSLMDDPTTTTQIDTISELNPSAPGERIERGRPNLSRILMAILGADFDENCSWEELGMSSMAAVELQSQISEKLFVILPPTFQDDYPTPRTLRLFIENHSRKCLPVVLPTLPRHSSMELGWNMLGSCQVACVILMVLLIAFSFVPAYHFGKLIASAPRLNYATDRVKWQWLPVVVPAWMLSFSFAVILAKWVVIGWYREQEVSVTCAQFLRWWFIDRLVHVWETWVGGLIRDTPLIWLFYFLMGARIQPLAEIDAFIREFDLVEIGAQTKLQYDITCRRFSSWESEHGLFLRFRPIWIGRRCKIQGLVGLGACIGEGSHIKKLSAVAEGAQVPGNTRVTGSPAYNSGLLGDKENDDMSTATSYFAFGALKILWLFLELYFFFTFLLFGQWLLNGRLPPNFRYTPLLYWVLLLLMSAFLNVVTCILFKWLLIGKKRPGPVSSTFYSEAADWSVDYHYRISLVVVDTIFMSSKLVNIYLMALGMDIDMTSHVWAGDCPPSKVDLLSIRRSFFSVAHFDPMKDNLYHRIKVKDSSFGLSVVLKGGAEVSSSQIAPFSTVDCNTEGTRKITASHSSSLTFEVLSSMVLIFVVFWSVIPAYELFQYGTGHPPKIGFSVTKLAAVLVVQTVTWLFLFGLLQLATLRQSENSNQWRARSTGLYGVYLTVTCFLVGRWSLFPLAWGTPLASTYFKCLGSKVEGRMLHFTPSLYDFPLLTFTDGTIIDRCIASGHTVTVDGLQFGRTRLSGTLHEMALVLAHTELSSTDDSAPFRLAIQNAIPVHDTIASGHDPVEFGCAEQEHNEQSLALDLPYGGDDRSEVSC